MSIQSKIDRERFGPSLIEVTLGAALSILLGVLLAAGYLIFTPVRTLKVEPKADELARHEVVYIEGTRSPARSGQWMRKRQLLLEGQAAEIAIVEDELNAWIGEGTKPATGAEAPAAAFLQPAAVNFRIREGVIQVGVPSSLNAFGYTKPVIFQMRGGFEQRGDRFEFVPAESYLGSLALHRIPAAENFLIGALARTQSAAEDVAAAWDRVSAVAVEGNTLKVTLR
jgi:hypothetical protein